MPEGVLKTMDVPLRLSGLGASIQELLDVYKKQVLCVLEMAAPAWASALSKSDKRNIERVQKCALSIILGSNYHCYENALSVLNLKRLDDRRINLCEKFAVKASKNDQHKNWFCLAEQSEPVNTRSEKPVLKYKEPKTRTGRFANSPIPYLTKLLNEKHAKT